MNKNKLFLVLIVISVMALIGSTTACAPTAPAEPAAKPTINSFTASPTSISTGQKTTIGWDVSGATTITIEPGIGTSGPTGSLQLSPTADTTYSLTATNKAGSTTGSVTVTVTTVAAGMPDLFIEDVWLAAETIYYTVKNQGVAASKPTLLRLYVNGFEQDSKYLDVLAPGQEELNNFSAYQHLQQITTTKEGFEFAPSNIKVCIDEDNAVAESNEGNNCFNEMWGITETYDFTYYAHRAKWRSGDGDVRWDGRYTDEKGAVFLFLGELTTCPEKVSNGWILGRFYDFSIDEQMNISSQYGGTMGRSREIEVPENAKFISELGFRRGENSTDGVRVALGYLDEKFSMVLFPQMDVYSDGQLHTYEVDLGNLAGKRTEFFLYVEAKNSPEGDCVKWVNPRIIQE